MQFNWLTPRLTNPILPVRPNLNPNIPPPKNPLRMRMNPLIVHPLENPLVALGPAQPPSNESSVMETSQVVFLYVLRFYNFPCYYHQWVFINIFLVRFFEQNLAIFSFSADIVKLRVFLLEFCALIFYKLSLKLFIFIITIFVLQIPDSYILIFPPSLFKFTVSAQEPTCWYSVALLKSLSKLGTMFCFF